MTDFVQGKHGQNADKKAQQDIVFDVGDLTFVKPATPLGKKSDFYGARRPRFNEVSFDKVKHVAITVPAMSPVEYRRIRAAMADDPLLLTYDTWQSHVREALALDNPLEPVVPVRITCGGLEAWRRRHPGVSGTACLSLLANEQYCKKASALLHQAQEFNGGEGLRAPYIFVITEVIGQDEANDLSHITIVYGQRRETTPIVRNARVPFARALSLGTAHALKLGIPQVAWAKDLEYAWT